MARRNWMPRSIPARAKFLEHLDQNLIHYKDDLKIEQGDLDLVHKCNLIYAYFVKNKKNLASFIKAFNSYFNELNSGKSGKNLSVLPKLSDFGLDPELVPSNIFGFISELRRTLMNHDNYSVGIGLALMFYGAEINFKKDDYKPTIKVIVRGKKIKIITSVIDVKNHQIYLKIGKSKGYVIGKRMSSATIEFELPINTKNVGIPISVMLIGVIHDKEIGKYSDIVEILYRSDGKQHF